MEKKFVQLEQFGFQSQHSTVQQVLQVVEQITDDNRKQVIEAVFLDVAKAFDKVWHKGLLYKLLAASFPLTMVQQHRGLW